MTRDPKKMVAAGYDEIGETYLHWTAGSKERQRWLDFLCSRLTPASRILDLGCGAGIPAAREFTRRGFLITGIDGSIRQIEQARINEPTGEFVVADMTTAQFPAASFDAVSAFYSITHVPRAEHHALFQSVYTWLNPGGLFLASLGYADTPEWIGEWLGTQMHFSHFDAATNRQMIADAGFEIDCADVVGEIEYSTTVHFLWVLARKPF